MGVSKVRIDGSNWVQPQGTGEVPQPVHKPSSSADSADAKIAADGSQTRSALAPYVRAAMAAEEVNELAVAEARKLLRSGQLDTLDAARRAAEALLARGI